MPSPYKSTLEYKKVTAETFHATPTHSITQNQMIQDIEMGQIDKKLIELSAQRIIDFKKQIPSTSHGKENLSDLARDHIELIREMKSHLP